MKAARVALGIVASLIVVIFGANAFLHTRRPLEVLIELDRAARQNDYARKRALLADPLEVNSRVERLTEEIVETYYRFGIPAGEIRVFLDPKAPLSRYLYGPCGMVRVGLTVSGWQIDGVWATTCQAHPMEDYILRNGIELFRVDTPVE